MIASGATGGSLLTGCLGDDDDVPDVDDADVPAADDDDVADDTDDELADDAADPTDDTDVADADDADPATDRHDVTVMYSRGPPMPADGQLNPYAGGAEPLVDYVALGMNTYRLLGRSAADMQPYGTVIDSWDYTPGILEFELRDDIYWWSGDVANAEDVVSMLELQDWYWGGDELDDAPSIIAVELLDEDRFRISLVDTWREEWALEQTMIAENLVSSRTFNQKWLDRFEDTGGDMDAVEIVREDLDEHAVGVDQHEEDLVHFHTIPFEFRFDGSIGDVGEDYWYFELVPEKNGTKRAFVDEINYTGVHWIIAEESDPVREAQFLDGEDPWATTWEWAEDADFDTRIVEAPRPEGVDRWGFTYNCEVHPTDVPQFRRAWVFLTNRSLWELPEYPIHEHATPFLTDDRLHSQVSEEVIDAFTDFRADEVQEDRAREELEIGGFEQNGNGAWLNQETGEPIEFVVPAWDWIPTIEHGSDFIADLEEFGIGIEAIPGHWSDGDPWKVFAGYTGGFLPENVFASIFGENPLIWAAPNANLDETVEAPPVGATDAEPGEWIEYDTRTMADRLGVTIDSDQWQELVDQLAWVANQIQPRTTIVGRVPLHAVNDHHWDVEEIHESPEKWLRDPERHIFWNGAVSYVPEDQR